MIYELAHFIRDKISFVWDLVEWSNALFFGWFHSKGLKNIPRILAEASNETFTIRMTKDDDALRLVKFFNEQPEEAFVHFNPHSFDEKSIIKILRNKAFMTFVVTASGEIVGYFFLRAFINGICFRGKIVHKDWQGKGVAKLMGIAMTDVAASLGLRMFGSISPQNYASMASAKASNEIVVHKTLKNGDYYIEFLPKK